MREVLEGFDGSRSEADRRAEPRATMVELFGHLAEHRELSVHLLDVSDGRLHPANSELRGVIEAHFTHSMEALGADQPVDTDTTATFLVGGLMAMLVAWLAEPQCTSEQLASAFSRLVPSWLAANPEFDRPLRITSRTSAPG
ncbi:TetR-like C-terminal domain-containing protein [Rhodococcus cercidiphylli]|nr:TetR-like C-terminal domain-containing protein [Rhodococcus cercidiphylli]